MKTIIILISFFLFVCISSICAESSDSTCASVGFFPVDLGRYETLIDVKVIDSQNMYDSLTTILREKHSWLKEEPPEIDFEHFMLVGDESWADGSASFSYEVQGDTTAQIVIITIIEHYGGGRGMNVFEHWFLIDKMPEEYSVEFRYEEGEPKNRYED